MTEQVYKNAMIFIENGARAMAVQEPNLERMSQLTMAGAHAQKELTALYESQPKPPPPDTTQEPTTVLVTNG